jgi:hypothetical protein
MSDKFKWTKHEIFPPLKPLLKYQLSQTFLLSLVPLICGVLLLLLLMVFSKLNLYYLEANGLILDEQVRDAYFHQVQLELFDVVWFLVMQLVATSAAAFVVMRWASSPFLSAKKMVLIAGNAPEKLQPASKALTESHIFDRYIWSFCLRVKGGGENNLVNAPLPYTGVNFLFLLKFFLTFTMLSIVTGYVMNIILSSVYERIITLALELLRNTNTMGHYFLAQQDVLRDATYIMTSFSLVIYFFMGIHISKYMSEMIYVFSRALKEDRFPITLRGNDLYHDLADTMNQARMQIKG